MDYIHPAKAPTLIIMNAQIGQFYIFAIYLSDHFTRKDLFKIKLMEMEEEMVLRTVECKLQITTA